MDWVMHQDPKGFALEIPTGWRVQALPGPTVLGRSADGSAVVIIQSLASVPADGAGPMLASGMFPAAVFLTDLKVGTAESGPDGSAVAWAEYRNADGSAGRARIGFTPMGAGGRLFVAGATPERYAEMTPVLARILGSYRVGPALASKPQAAVNMAGALGGIPAMNPGQTINPGPAISSTPAAAAAPPPLPAGAGPVAYTRFADPQMNAFTLQVPRGWQVRGGLAHPQLGDRRPWVEAMSPEGIFILNGDPECPQCFCHFPGQGEGVQVPLAAGGLFVNLKPSAEGLTNYYLKTLAARRLGAFQAQPRRARPDIVEMLKRIILAAGVQIPRKYQLWAIETPFVLNNAGQMRVGSLLTTGGFNGEYAMGMWTFWEGNVFLYIAPPHLAARADEVRRHMIESYQPTPQWHQLVQQDEAMITANGNAANAAQWNWFAGQQQAYAAQLAVGDAIVSNYWAQQKANDQMLRGWEQTQAVNDRLSQDRSDAMLGNQRLAGDGMGKQYDVPAGYDYYWLDPQSGTITGTNTSTPPDYSRNYTMLRKM